MGFFTNLISGTIKTALTPVAIIKDAANIVLDEEQQDVTKKLLESAGDDLEEAFEDLGDGEL